MNLKKKYEPQCIQVTLTTQHKTANYLKEHFAFRKESEVKRIIILKFLIMVSAGRAR